MKKTVAIAAILLIIAAAPAFSDTSKLIAPYHWSYRCLELLSQKGILTQEIVPGKTALTAEQTVMLIVRALNRIQREPTVMGTEELQAMRQLINGYEREIGEVGYELDAMKRDLENYAMMAGLTAFEHSQERLEAPKKLSGKASEAVNEFTFKLYSEVVSSGAGNTVMSPYSISTALAMVYAGARGATEAEMERVLLFDPGIDRSMAALIAEMSSVPEEAGTLKTANALWTAKNLEMIPGFVSTIERYYNAPLYRMDFANRPEHSRRQINDWVEMNTGSKIKNMVPQGFISGLTRLVLTNAVYFKADWAAEFEPENTRAKQFKCDDGTEVSTMMMTKTESDVNYISNDEVKAISIPYRAGRFSMKVMLPPKETKLEDFERNLTHEKVKEWTSAMTPHRVKMTIPKFKTEVSFSLADTLRAMGMETAFGDGANLSGITLDEQLALDEVLHKTFIEVAEEGTEAAAATAVLIKYNGMPYDRVKPVYFKADRPFIYFITDDSTGAVIFIGRYVKP